MATASKSYDVRWAPDQVNECAELWGLTVEEKDKLLLLQDQIKDIDHSKNDPYEIVRFLKEFRFNLKTTEQKFRASIQWRLENNADHILEEYTPPALYNYFPLAVLEGADNEGDPIYIERSGAADSLGLLHRFGKEEMIKQAIWCRELMGRGPWQNEWPGKIRSFTAILDLKGLNRHHLHPSVIPVGQQVTRLVQDNYPGLGKKILIIRAPYFFRFVWSIFKHFVDPHVKDLIEIATEKETEKMLAKYMDLRVMPKEILPEKGQGRAVKGYEPVWGGGPLPPPAKDDWKRGTPIFPESETEMKDAFASRTKTPIRPTISASSMSSASSTSEWESLPKRTSRKNIQQAWTVTGAAPIFDLEDVWKKENFTKMAILWKLNQVDQINMEELRDRIVDVQHRKNDPYEVVRSYIEGYHGGKGDLDKIEHKFRKMVAWRVENKMDDYLQQYGQPDPLFHQMPMCILRGTDMDGDPVVLQRMGACDYKSLLKHFGEDKMVDYILFLRELNISRRFWGPYEEEAGHRVKQVTVIIDLEGLNTGLIKPGPLHLLKRVSRMLQDYYGGYPKRILLIRAPGVFRLIWNVVKNFFDEQVRSKFQVSGDDYLSFLDKFIDREVLPPVICPEEGVGGGMPGYYENINLEGGHISKVAFKKLKEQYVKSTPVFPPQPETLGYNLRSTPMPPGSGGDDFPGYPVNTTHLLMGYWGGEEVENSSTRKEESSIRAFPTPEKDRTGFSSPMFKYSW